MIFVFAHLANQTNINEEQQLTFEKMFHELRTSLQHDLAKESHTQRTQLDHIQTRLDSKSNLICSPVTKQAHVWFFACGTAYCRRIQPAILSNISAYYDALERHEVTFCYYCDEFHPNAFCLPGEFPVSIVDLFFSLLEHQVYISY